MRSIVLLIFLVPFLTYAQPSLQLEEFADGFSDPVDIAHAGDSRLFIVEREGYIRIVDSLGNVFPDYFLDIHSLVESGYNEQGLLGLAFHPDYAENGYFYVHYTDLDGNTVIARYSVSTFNPNIADPTTDEIIYDIEDPFVNHNGGCLKFGPDGYLYMGFGDGGSAGDPGNRAQNPENKLGKMSRIDVNGELPYLIPPDNPFADAADTLPEIWAIGYRNPWRFSFDRLTGDMWVADVGQNLVEEIDFEPAGMGGLNYGWRCYESFDEFNTTGCDEDSTYTYPIMDYPHNFSTGGFAVTGGFVYRGTKYPGMFGYYLCADFVSGNWWWIVSDGAGGWTNERIDDLQLNISSFGEDINGELYCSELYSGQIFRISDACGNFMIDAVATDYICGVQDGAIDLSIEDGALPYDIEWSTGDDEEDLSGLTAGNYSVTVTDDEGCERSLSVTVNEIPPFTPAVSFVDGILSTDMGVSWQWYFNGSDIAGATSMEYTPLEDGIYSVLVTDANGCSVMSADINVLVDALDEYGLIGNVEIYPVPVDDVLQVQIIATAFSEEFILSICDMSGRTISGSTRQIHIGENTFSINTESLAPGIYYLNLIAGEEIKHIAFVK